MTRLVIDFYHEKIDNGYDTYEYVAYINKELTDVVFENPKSIFTIVRGEFEIDAADNLITTIYNLECIA